MNQPLTNPALEKRRVAIFQRVFCLTATSQARAAYFLMAIHVANPEILTRVCKFDPCKYLFLNMVYGYTLMIYARPSMIPLSTFHRIVFSVLGSLMFNHSSMLVFSWLRNILDTKPVYLSIISSVIIGRLMLMHFLAYLYHVDSRSRNVRLRSYNEFEDMYRD